MTIAELQAVIDASGLPKTGERRSLLMEKFKLGCGDATAVALSFGKALPALDDAASAPATADAGDPLDAICADAKAPLRALHEAVMGLVKGFGPFEAAPKKAYLSLRRKKRFAMVGLATKDQIEIGLNAKAQPASARLTTAPARAGSCRPTGPSSLGRGGLDPLAVHEGAAADHLDHDGAEAALPDVAPVIVGPRRWQTGPFADERRPRRRCGPGVHEARPARPQSQSQTRRSHSGTRFVRGR